MHTKYTRIQRSGHIYHFSVNDVEHKAFIWQLGKQFHGRVEGAPHIPQCRGRSALAVRDALQQLTIEAAEK